MKKYFVEVEEFDTGVTNVDLAKLIDFAFPLNKEAAESLFLGPIGTQLHITFNEGAGAYILETIHPPVISWGDNESTIEIQIICKLSVV